MPGALRRARVAGGFLAWLLPLPVLAQGTVQGTAQGAAQGAAQGGTAQGTQAPVDPLAKEHMLRLPPGYGQTGSGLPSSGQPATQTYGPAGGQASAPPYGTAGQAAPRGGSLLGAPQPYGAPPAPIPQVNTPQYSSGSSGPAPVQTSIPPAGTAPAMPSGTPQTGYQQGYGPAQGGGNVYPIPPPTIQATPLPPPVERAYGETGGPAGPTAPAQRPVPSLVIPQQGAPQQGRAMQPAPGGVPMQAGTAAPAAPAPAPSQPSQASAPSASSGAAQAPGTAQASGSAGPPQASSEPPNVWLPAGAATLQALDKVNAQASTLTVKVGQSVTFGSLTIIVRSCVIRPNDQPANAAAFVDVTDSHPDGSNFSGWLLENEPAVSIMQHPIYDLRVAGCA